MTRAYYNEIDPYAARWLRNLISEGLIADGDIDERSIVDVRGSDLAGYAQCHFFAGLGGWAYALGLAEWGERPVWTGSCPCQPLSGAGQRKGHADERHLWPAFHSLIAECRPATVFGEQVASADGREWLAGVRADLEALGYACGAADLCAAGVGAPHPRQRLYWVADSDSMRRPQSQRGVGFVGRRVGDGGDEIERLDDTSSPRHPPSRLRQPEEPERRQRLFSVGRMEPSRLGHAPRPRLQGQWSEYRPSGERHSGLAGLAMQVGVPEWNGPTVAVKCSDGARRISAQPVLQLMADGVPASLGPICAAQVAALTEEITHACSGEANARKAMQDVRCAIVSQAVLRQSAGGFFGVYEAPVLFAFLRQLTDQGWAFSEGVSRTCSQNAAECLRGVWRHDSTPRSSCRRGFDEQRDSQSSDALYQLPSILARHAQSAWDQAFQANAKSSFPLISGDTDRAGRLRAYGNAIVPQVAAQFVGAFLEC